MSNKNVATLTLLVDILDIYFYFNYIVINSFTFPLHSARETWEEMRGWLDMFTHDSMNGSSHDLNINFVHITAFILLNLSFINASICIHPCSLAVPSMRLLYIDVHVVSSMMECVILPNYEAICSENWSLIIRIKEEWMFREIEVLSMLVRGHLGILIFFCKFPNIC